MNPERPLIKLYRTRTFGEKMSDTFDFVRENWRPMLKYITYLLLPLSLIQAFTMGNFMTGYMTFTTQISNADMATMLPWLTSMGVTMLLYYLSMMLLCALIYTMMQLYEQRPQRLQGITFAELRPGIINKCIRSLVLLVAGIVLMLVAGLIFAPVMIYVPLLLFLVFIVACLALPLFALVQPIYLFEKIGILTAYVKSIRLGWHTWAGIVAVLFVLYIIVSIVQGVVSMPYYIMMTLKSVLSMQSSSGAFVSSFEYTAAQYLLGAISFFCGNCLMSLLTIGTAYQYGHACDKVDGVGVDRDIENFETLNIE